MKTARKTTQRRDKGRAKQPFSLILNPDELSILRKMARKEGTSVAYVVRGAVQEMLSKKHPELRQQFLEAEVGKLIDQFLEKIGRKATPAKRKKLAKILLSF